MDVLLFLELSDSSTVEADAAAGLLEQVAQALQRLESDAKTRFIDYVKRRALQTEPGATREVLKSLPEDLGFAGCP